MVRPGVVVDLLNLKGTGSQNNIAGRMQFLELAP